MFYLINFMFFSKYIHIMILMPATCFKKVGTGATRVWESCGMLTFCSIPHKNNVNNHTEVSGI